MCSTFQVWSDWLVKLSNYDISSTLITWCILHFEFKFNMFYIQLWSDWLVKLSSCDLSSTPITWCILLFKFNVFYVLSLMCSILLVWSDQLIWLWSSFYSNHLMYSTFQVQVWCILCSSVIWWTGKTIQLWSFFYSNQLIYSSFQVWFDFKCS